MQPDPQHFLHAIRRELLRADLFTAARESGLAPILTMRAGEGLLHLAARTRAVPGIVRALQPRLRALLDAAAAQLELCGIERPAAMERAMALGSAVGPFSEQDIHVYELRAEAVAAAIAALASQRGSQAAPEPAFDAICLEASAIESELRTACSGAVQELRAEFDRDPLRTAAASSEVTAGLLEALLRPQIPPPFAVRDVQRLPGLNAQEVYFFHVEGLADGGRDMVLRRAPAWSATRSSLADEAGLLVALGRLGLPVPRVLMSGPEGSSLGGSFIIMERLPGVTQSADALGSRGRSLGLALARLMARIHQVDARALGGVHRDDGQPMARRMEALLDRSYQRWQAERGDVSMAVEAAFAWLRAHTHRLGSHVSLVHGDCNFRNILIDGERISAVLDWELAHLGHAAEDLTYVRPDIEQFMPWADFMAAYLAAGGRSVSTEELRYFEVWKDVWRTSLAACIYGSYLRGEHQNFIFGTVAYNEYFATLDPLATFMAHEAYRS